MIAKLIRLLYFWLMICPLGCLPQSSQPGNQSHSWILLIRSCHWWDILHYVLLQSYALLCQIFHSISECIYTCPRWPFISSSVMHKYIYTTNFGFHWLTYFLIKPLLSQRKIICELFRLYILLSTMILELLIHVQCCIWLQKFLQWGTRQFIAVCLIDHWSGIKSY